MRFDAQLLGETTANDLRFRQVFFRNRDDLRPFAEFRVELLELVPNRLIVRDRVGSVDRGRLDQVKQNAGALDVSQEVVSEPDAEVRARIVSLVSATFSIGANKIFVVSGDVS